MAIMKKMVMPTMKNEPRHRKVRSSRYAPVAVEIGNGEYASKADARVVVKAAADQPVGAGASVGG